MADAPTADPQTCPHPAFEVQANAERVTLQNGSLGSVLLHVSANCAACKASFWIPGLGTGRSHTEPTTSPDGFIATLPLVQDGRRCQPDPTLGSVMLRNNDIHKGRKTP